MLDDQKYSMKLFICKNELEQGFPIYLKIYHMTKMNHILQFLGLGLYHTSLEIDNYEYSFGSTDDDISGIYINNINENNENNELGNLKITLKEKIYLGNTLFNHEIIKDLILLNSSFWSGNSYDPFLKNCNHFTRFLSIKLLLEEIQFPEYVNRVTEYGMFLNCFYDPLKKIYGDCNNIPKNAMTSKNNYNEQNNKNKEKNEFTIKKRCTLNQNEENNLISKNQLNCKDNNFNFLTQINLNDIEFDINNIDDKGDNLKNKNMSQNDFKQEEIVLNYNSNNKNYFNHDKLNFLKNSNLNEDNLFVKITKKISNLIKDEKDKICYNNIFKYIKLGDRFLYEEINIEKAKSTFLYCLEMIEELYEILNENKNEIFSSKSINTFSDKSKYSKNFVKFLMENEDILINLKLKSFYSLLCISENKKDIEMILVYKDKIEKLKK